MPSIGPLEMILVLLYDVVALSVLALFVYASIVLVMRILRAAVTRG
jgi:hypothetical protein